MNIYFIVDPRGLRIAHPKKIFTEMLYFLNFAIKRIYMVPQLVIGQILDSYCGTAVPQLEH